MKRLLVTGGAGFLGSHLCDALVDKGMETICVDNFFSGSKEDMRKAIGDCVTLAPTDSGYILSTGCEVPGVASPEKVGWFMELANELCRLD